MIILALSGLLLLDTNTSRMQNNRIQPFSSRSPFRTSDFCDSSFPAEERHRYRARDRHSLHSASNRPIPNAVTKTEYGVQVAPFCLPPNLRDSYHSAMRSNTPRSRQADERLSFKSRSPQSKKAGRQAHPPTLNALASPRLIAPLPRRTPSPPRVPRHPTWYGRSCAGHIPILACLTHVRHIKMPNSSKCSRAKVRSTFREHALARGEKMAPGEEI